MTRRLLAAPRPASTFTLLTITRQLRRHRRLLAALVAAWAAYATIATLRPEPPATRAIAVAAHDLAAGSVISVDDLQLRPWPATAVPPAAVTELSALVGRALAVPVPVLGPVTIPMVVGPGSLALQSRANGRASVAIPVRLSDSGVAALLATGDLVDVWATPGADLPGAAPGPPAATRVAAGARVVAVPRPVAGDALTAGGGGLVVLSVGESAVPALAYAAASARISVTLLPRSS